MITESEMNIMDVNEYTIPKFGVMFGTNLYKSFDKVEKDKKLELLRLTLYRNLVYSKTMDMVDLLKETKIKRSQYVTQKCKVTIKNDIPIDVVKIKHNVKNKRKKMINFISIELIT